MWRNFPCMQTYYNLPPVCRPTPLQMLVPHSPTIDWLPWPELRDLAIKNEDRLNMDDLTKLAIEHTVLERQIPISTAATVEKQETTFRVWDFYQLEEQNGANFQTNDLTYSPGSPSLCALQKVYNLQFSDVSNLKLDKKFFDTIPFMYTESVVTKCLIKRLHIVSAKNLGLPIELSGQAFRKLNTIIKSVINTGDCVWS